MSQAGGLPRAESAKVLVSSAQSLWLVVSCGGWWKKKSFRVTFFKFRKLGLRFSSFPQISPPKREYRAIGGFWMDDADDGRQQLLPVLTVPTNDQW